MVHRALGSAGIHSATPVRYLQTVRKLLGAYQRARGVQQPQIVVKMMHAFMQDW